MKKENIEYCKNVADELKDLYDKGNLTEYFDDILDVRYIVNSKKEYLYSQIWVTLGGPSVWVDTQSRTVELRWLTDSASYPIHLDVVEYIDEIMREIFDN